MKCAAVVKSGRDKSIADIFLNCSGKECSDLALNELPLTNSNLQQFSLRFIRELCKSERVDLQQSEGIGWKTILFLNKMK